MKRTLLLTSILIVGLLLSQFIPNVFPQLPESFYFMRQFLTMFLLSVIMIEVGREFEIDLKNKKKYIIDYGVAATAAGFPWILVTAYFIFFLMPDSPVSDSGRAVWMEMLLTARFAAPTSAGVLFSMLAAAGLSHTWVFQKTRVLAIFDDLDTVLLMIPLNILMIGLVWQLGGILLALGFILFLGLRYYKKWNLPTSWGWIFTYAFIITFVSEILYLYTKDPVTKIGMHIEVLLPAFMLGCMIKKKHHEEVLIPGEDPEGMSQNELIGFIVSSTFMFFVGFSMPVAFGEHSQLKLTMSPQLLFFHVMMVTILANLGKMFAMFCYKKEATFKERLAVSVALFPRGEVGAGVLAVALGYGINGVFVTVAFMSLALNLILTGLFIYIVKLLLKK